MGQIVAAALASHHPGVMAPEEIRVSLGDGRDTTLVEGFHRMRQALDAANPDTLVILDTHWFTTLNHLVTGAEHYQGLYTSEELPQLLSDVPYDYPGAPELASAVEEVGRERGVPTIAVRSTAIAQHYPTLNLMHYLRKGERVMSTGMCQHALMEQSLEFGEVLGEAIRRTDCRAALLAARALSHAFPPLGTVPQSPRAWDPANISSAENRALDARVIDLLERGDHASVLELWPELLNAKIEGFGGHYLQMIGALGGREFRGKGTPLSEYECALGTGNIHMWFDVDGQN